MKHKNIINYIVAIAVVTLMVAMSEILGDKEIIFPEVAALCVGSIVLPAFPWVVNEWKMVFYITICAILGVLIVCFIPMPLWGQLILAFILSQVIFLLSRTTMAPMISAICLPVMIQTRSIVYIISAFCLTTLIVVIRLIFVKEGHKLSVVYKPVDSLNKDNIILAIKRCILVSILILATVPQGYKFILAPPLLVAFTELSKKGNKAIKKPLHVVILVGGCALLGAMTRLLITVYIDLPLSLSAFIIITAALLIMRAMKLYMPPAAALGILALLIPEKNLYWYPLQIFAGIIIFIAMSKLLSKDKI